jgi:hypothetical protein
MPRTPPPIPYHNWYWNVANSATQVYSSAAGDYVPLADASYQAWLALGNSPTAIASEAALGALLPDWVPRPIPAGILDGFKIARATGVVNAVQFKVLFNHENRLRAIERSLGLNGSPADLTAGQAINAIKLLM